MGNATLIGTGHILLLGFSTNNTTVHMPCGLAAWNSFGFASTANIAFVQTKARAAGTITRLGVRVRTNTRSGSSTTFKFEIGGTGGNNVATVGASSTGWFNDTTHSDTVADGDLISVQMTTGASGGGNTIDPTALWMKHTATTGTVQYFSWRGHDDDVVLSTASATRYSGIAGRQNSTSPESTEGKTTAKLRVAGTVSHVQIYVNTNGFSGAGSVNIRKNSGAANGTATITGSTTGLFEDTTNSDTFAAGDTIDFSWVSGSGSGSLKPSLIACKFASDSTDFELASHSNKATNATGYSNSVPTYFPLMGGCEAGSTTESDLKLQVPLSLKIDKLRVQMRDNSSSNAQTCTVRKNAAASAVTASVTGSSTGLFEDTSNSFNVSDTDDINIEMSGSNSTNVSPQYFMVRANTSINADTGTPGTQRGPGVLSGQ